MKDEDSIVIVTLTPEQKVSLQYISDGNKTDYNQSIIDSIQCYQFLIRQIMSGRKILVEKDGIQTNLLSLDMNHPLVKDLP